MNPPNMNQRPQTIPFTSSNNQARLVPASLQPLNNYTYDEPSLKFDNNQLQTRPQQPRNSQPRNNPRNDHQQPQHFSFVSPANQDQYDQDENFRVNQSNSHTNNDNQNRNSATAHRDQQFSNLNSKMQDNHQEQQQEMSDSQQQWQQENEIIQGTTQPTGMEIFSLEYMETLLNLLQSSPELSQMQFSSDQLTYLLSSEEFQGILADHFAQNGQSLSPFEMANLLLAMLTSGPTLDADDNPQEQNPNDSEHSQQAPSEQVITCSKCGEIPDNYLELNCSHAFCLDCMACCFIEYEYIDIDTAEVDVDCMICGTRITIDSDSVEAVLNTINTIRINLQQSHQQQLNLLPLSSPHQLLPQEIIYEDSGETFQTEETTRNQNKHTNQSHENNSFNFEKEHFLQPALRSSASQKNNHSNEKSQSIIKEQASQNISSTQSGPIINQQQMQFDDSNSNKPRMSLNSQQLKPGQQQQQLPQQQQSLASTNNSDGFNSLTKGKATSASNAIGITTEFFQQKSPLPLSQHGGMQQVKQQSNMNTVSSPTLQSDRTHAPSQTASIFQRSTASTPSHSYSAEKVLNSQVAIPANEIPAQQLQLEGVKEQIMEDEEDDLYARMHESSSTAFDARNPQNQFSIHSSVSQQQHKLLQQQQLQQQQQQQQLQQQQQQQQQYQLQQQQQQQLQQKQFHNKQHKQEQLDYLQFSQNQCEENKQVQQNAYYCPEHTQEVLNFFNLTRNRGMCLKCIQQKQYVQDEIQSIEKAERNLSKLLKQSLEESHVASDILGMAERQLIDEMESFTWKLDEQRNAINAQIDKVIESIVEKKRDLANHSEAAHAAANAKLQQEKELIEEAIVHLDQLAPHFENINEHSVSPSPHIFNIFAASTDILQQFLHSHRRYLTLPMISSNKTTSTRPNINQTPEIISTTNQNKNNGDHSHVEFDSEATFEDQINQLQMKISELNANGRKIQQSSTQNHSSQSATKYPLIRKQSQSQEQQKVSMTPSPIQYGTGQLVNSQQQLTTTSSAIKSSAKPFYKSSTNPNYNNLQSSSYQQHNGSSFPPSLSKQQQQYQQIQNELFNDINQGGNAKQSKKGTLLWSDEDDLQLEQSSISNNNNNNNNVNNNANELQMTTTIFQRAMHTSPDRSTILQKSSSYSNLNNSSGHLNRNAVVAQVSGQPLGLSGSSQLNSISLSVVPHAGEKQRTDPGGYSYNRSYKTGQGSSVIDIGSNGLYDMNRSFNRGGVGGIDQTLNNYFRDQQGFGGLNQNATPSITERAEIIANQREIDEKFATIQRQSGLHNLKCASDRLHTISGVSSETFKRPIARIEDKSKFSVASTVQGNSSIKSRIVNEVLKGTQNHKINSGMPFFSHRTAGSVGYDDKLTKSVFAAAGSARKQHSDRITGGGITNIVQSKLANERNFGNFYTGRGSISNATNEEIGRFSAGGMQTNANSKVIIKSAAGYDSLKKYEDLFNRQKKSMFE